MPAAPTHPFLDKEGRKIRRLFDFIAPRYDLLNHLLSFHLDRVWRRRAVAALAPRPGGRYLDACTGTGDMAFALARRTGEWNGTGEGTVVAGDFSLPMLRLGVAKARARGGGFPRFLAADTLMLPFEARTFDGAVVGFGIRNVERLDEGLRELERVLRPGARLVLLEFTELRNPLLGPCFRLYLRKVLPAVGNWVSGSRERAYSYLQSSVDHWPDGDGLAEQMRRAGFRGVTWRPLFPGNVALHAGVAARGER